MRVVCLVGALGSTLVFAGCGNPCAAMCEDMKSFAEACGYEVPTSEVDACVEAQADADRDDRGVCRDFGDIGIISETWDCLVIADYYPEQSAGE